MLQIPMTANVIERMASHGDFNIGDTDITVSTTECNADIRLYFFATSGKVCRYSISGFPRDFLTEDDWTRKSYRLYSKAHILTLEIVRNSEEADEEQEANEEPLSLNRARTRRRISTGQDQELGHKASKPHLRSASEQNLSTQPHGIKEENRRNSDDVVPKSGAKVEVPPRASGFKSILHHQSSRIGLGSRRDKDAQLESLPRPPIPSVTQQAPSIVVTSTIPEDQHSQFPHPPRPASTSSAHSDSRMDGAPSSRSFYSTNTSTRQDEFNLESAAIAAPVERQFVEPLANTYSPQFGTAQSFNPTISPHNWPTAQRPWNEAPTYPQQNTSIYYTPYHPPNAGPSSSSTAPRYTNEESLYSVPPQVGPQQSSLTLNRPSESRPNISGLQPSGNILRDSEEDSDWELEMAKRASMVDFEKIKEEEEYMQALENSIMHK